MSIMEMNNDIFTADYVVFLYSSLCAVSSFWWVQSRERFLAQTD
ncbi:putative membrane protein [Escherichia coli 2-011-08_S3_C3]|nr:putative membrane protein [Escherichia coli 1-250-04_S4_C2]EZJ60366.1 putative membrane protein [Escherichia coli 1-250-04_S4_C1]KDA82093.1 putative membrane protein [Escherichia coli 2-011-08_S3_C3]KDT06637.1 putative membrane protein [Escherichia coli 2-011-08_S3_C1]KDY52959.1 putative membrane protein [Escherichia coli 2-460-02_S3_C2]KDY56308.1 putative membrane protein [Escherichia coli 2-460-02_S3_C3]